MKKKVLLYLLLCASLLGFSQIDANSVMGIPVASTTDMNNITGAQEGSFLYNSTNSTMFYYNGSTWIEMVSTTPDTFVGSFIISAPGGTTDFTTGVQKIPVPFQPSQISFVAHANIEGFPIDDRGSGGTNTATLQNAFGTMNGFARDDVSGTVQSTIYVGGSGSSINSISRYSSSLECIGLRYSNNNGIDMGKITATIASFDPDGFTINYNYFLGESGNVNRDNDILDESLVVFFTAYK